MKMRKFFYLYFVVALIVVFLSVPVLVCAADSEELVLHRWTLLQGTVTDDSFRAVAVDHAGAVYTVGTTSGAFSLNVSSGGTDAFVAKYDLSGNLLWLRQFGTFRDDEAVSVVVDTAGAVYVAGTTYGNLASTGATGTYSDVFIARFDAAGQLSWIRQFGSIFQDQAQGVAIDPSGTIVIVGNTEDSMDGSTNAGYADIFIAKYSLTGNRIWITQKGTSAHDEAHGVCVDSAGTIYIAGMTRGSFTTVQNTFYSQALLMKYDATGNTVWIQQFGTSGDDDADAVALDSRGNIYVAGRVANEDRTTSDKQDAFTAKFDAAGNRLWIAYDHSTGEDRNYGVAVDSANYIYSVGYAGGDLNERKNAGYQDVVVLKYDTDGNRQWTYLYGSSRTDIAYAVTVDSANNVYVAGLSDGNLGDAVNAGGNDAFLFKIRPNFRPVLAWTGETGYERDGISPDRDAAAVPYMFRVKYIDSDDHEPRGGYPAVHVYLFPHIEISGSPFTLAETDPADRVVTDGKLYSYTMNLAPGQYYYTYEAYDMHGSSAAGIAGIGYPGPVVIGTLPSTSSAKLYHGIFKPGEREQCYVSCDIAGAGDLKVTIYDSLGKSVRELFNAPVAAGVTTLLWDGRASDGTMSASGVYLIDIRAPGIKQTRRVVLVR